MHHGTNTVTVDLVTGGTQRGQNCSVKMLLKNEVCTFNAEEKLQQVIKAGQNDDLRVRLSTAINPSDARAIDVKYHLPYWVKNVDRDLKPNTGHCDPEECEKHCNHSKSGVDFSYCWLNLEG